jgi:hypothetical protein
MDEGCVYHPIRGSGATSQAVQILHISAMNFRASGRKRFGARIRARKTKHLMAGVDKFANQSGADKTCSTS